MSSKAKYAAGEIVTLKSGGPEMTIKEVISPSQYGEKLLSYRCQWFAGKKLDSGVFPEASLMTPHPKS
ncbi:DUF2158 domain-containing protein [Yersinia enterocolitica]|uniref:YodC family protein n=1 Tax=Yersinia mollaretii TaxID=33060 RepID=UPI0005E3A198|nr:DUF2158 domain-containing protein [Yersinia mollaretii]CQR03487.1 Uncharacterized small protein [Yersinia mollaretii]